MAAFELRSRTAAAHTEAPAVDRAGCRPVLLPRLLVSESGCWEAPPGHASWSRAVNGDRLGNQLRARMQTRRFLTPLAAGWPPVPIGYPATRTHQPTASTKKDLQMHAFPKRLKGFEPSTFCMASRRRRDCGVRRYPCK